MSRRENFDVAGEAPVSTGRRIGQFASFGFTVVIVLLCLRMLPTAWLNLRHLTDPERFPAELANVELERRSALSITLRYQCVGKDNVRGVASGGIIAKWQYDKLTAEAKERGGTPQFKVVYDARNPKRARLFDRMGGVETFAVLLFGLAYGTWELRRIVRSYRPA